MTGGSQLGALCLAVTLASGACGDDDGADASVADRPLHETTERVLGVLPPDPSGAPSRADIVVDGPGDVAVRGLPDGEWLVRLEAIFDDPSITVAAPWLVRTDEASGGLLARSRRVTAPLAPISIGGESGASVRLVLTARAIPPDADVARSLTWTDAAIADDPTIVSAQRAIAAASNDGHGGLLLDRLLRTFGETVHSERPRLVELADAFAATQGADPSRWDLGALPFRVTAVHNRIDLRTADHCGELRVSFTVTDPLFPFVHFLFLFAQGGDGDVSELGIRHCEETAFRWAWLARETGAGLTAGARAILDEILVHDRFLLAESLERTVGTWEWRQWTPTSNPDAPTAPALPLILTNPPLFQTIDVERINTNASTRDEFLAWLAVEADLVETRHIRIPDRFAPPSVRATEGVERPTLNLTGLATELEPRAEALRTALDRVGCPGCHSRSPTFVQTNPDRSFSEFYATELEARRKALDAFREGVIASPPFGSLADPE